MAWAAEQRQQLREEASNYSLKQASSAKLHLLLSMKLDYGNGHPCPGLVEVKHIRKLSKGLASKASPSESRRESQRKMKEEIEKI